jgi:hypothetical protein
MKIRIVLDAEIDSFSDLTTLSATLPGKIVTVEPLDEVPEVEVTYDRSPIHVVASERPPEARRSGAKNLSDPIYQNAFISEARASMGQPSIEDAKALLGQEVTLTFNVDWRPATGRLTDVVDHPATGGAPYLILDDYRERAYPLNAIQNIEVIS